MGMFPNTAPIPIVKPGPGPFPEPPPSPAAWPAGTGPGGIIQSFTPQAGGENLTLAALMQRQKEAVARGMQNMQQPQGTILGGLGQMANALFSGLEERRAAKDEAAGREEIVQAITGIDPETGIASPEQLATIMRRDPDMGLALYQQAMQARQDAANAEQWTQIPTPEGETGQWYQNQNGETKKVGGGTEAGGPKITDESGLRQDYIGSGSYKRMTESEPVYQSMLDAFDDTSAASDLNLVYGIAKLYDPTSVVREGEVVMQQGTQGMPDQVAGMIARWNSGDRTLQPEARKALMEQAFSRMNAYYDAVDADAKWYRETAARYKMNPDNIVKPFKRPRRWDEAPEPTDDDANDDATYG